MSDSAFVRVALLQLNPMMGDPAGNAASIAEAARAAWHAGARVAVAPELALSGYPPEDLLLRPAFLDACDRALADLAAALADCAGLHLVVGHPWRPAEDQGAATIPGGGIEEDIPAPHLFNAASVLAGGRVRAVYCKRELPNYRVFDERRYFRSGREAGLGPLVLDVDGLRLGLLICEDAWFDEPAQAARDAGAQALCVLNASPFHLGKPVEREARMGRLARAHQVPLLYAHLAGGQDELVFDGASFALDARGATIARAPMFETATLTVDLHFDLGAAAAVHPAPRSDSTLLALPSLEAQAWGALVTGVRDYVEKNRFPGVLLGLSGGIDSALVLAIAVDALGPQRVQAVMMPSPYTADISLVDARRMAEGLGVRYDEIDIAPVFDAFRAALAPQFAGLAEDTTEENLQARVRGTLLMALSNKSGAIVLTTGNKSEMATGYCTLYGDMAGGFAVIKDLTKTWVYRLAAWKNAQPRETVDPPIPPRIITRPPSAELRPDQTDQDSLPPYDVLDAILELHVEQDRSQAEIVAAGFDAQVVRRLVRLIALNEYKRRQAPPGVRLTRRAFGRDWRQPITCVRVPS